MADTTTEGLDPRFLPSLMAMIAASNGRIWINSGYRSVERQAQLYAKAQQDHPDNPRKYVAPPGHSNHNFGLAADLGGDLELAHQLAPQFGLYFPMSWEPWHVEPPFARQERGTAYKDSQTDPPVGHSGDTDPYGSLPHQLMVFQALVRGEPVDGFASVAAGDLTGGLGEPGGEPGAATGAGGGGDPAALYQALKAQGLDSVHAAALVAIAGRESSYDPSAHNGNADTGDDSWGLFQINKLGGQHSQWSSEQLSTWEGSVQAGAELFKQSGLQPWGGYKGVSWANGTNLEAAAAASGGEVTVEQLQAIQNEGM